MSLTPSPTRACRPFRGGTVTEPAGVGGFSQRGPEGPAAMGLSLAGAGEGRQESRAWHPAPPRRRRPSLGTEEMVFA